MKRSFENDDKDEEYDPPMKKLHTEPTKEYPWLTYEILDIDLDALDTYQPPKHWDKVCPCGDRNRTNVESALQSGNPSKNRILRLQKYWLSLQVLITSGIKTDEKLGFSEYHYVFIDNKGNICFFMDDYSPYHKQCGHGFYNPKWNFIQGGCTIEVYANPCQRDGKDFPIQFTKDPYDFQKFHRTYCYILRFPTTAFDNCYQGSFQQKLIELHFDCHSYVDNLMNRNQNPATEEKSQSSDNEENVDNQTQQTCEFLEYTGQYLPMSSMQCGCSGKYFISRLPTNGNFSKMFESYQDPLRLTLTNEFIIAYTLFCKDEYLKPFEQALKSSLLELSLGDQFQDIMEFTYYDFDLKQYIKQFPNEFDFTENSIKYHSIFQGMVGNEYAYLSNSIEYEDDGEDDWFDEEKCLQKYVNPLFKDYFPIFKDMRTWRSPEVVAMDNDPRSRILRNECGCKFYY